ncbi:MAG: Fic family protein [Terriglobia bacterium]
MEIQDPHDIPISADLVEILSDVSREAERLRLLGDFPIEVKREIAQAFLPERISDTLNIEGTRVNPRITRAVLQGLSLSETDRYNEREIRNVIEANELIEDAESKDAPLSASLIREIHKLVTGGLLNDAGTFRTQDVLITGASFTPPYWPDIPDLISRLSDLAETFLVSASQAESIIAACWLHATFAHIHPFMDGNGRVGRLLQDFVLVRAQLLPVGIPASRRQEYYEALSESDDGDWAALISIVADSELTALDKIKRTAEAPTRRREGIKKLIKVTGAAARQREYNQYELWRRRIDAVRDEFQKWADELNEATDIFQVRVKVWDPISFEKWQVIREQAWAENAWVFTLMFMVERRRIYSAVFYAHRHEFGRCLDEGEGLYKSVGLFLAGYEEGKRAGLSRFVDPYVRLREIVYNDKGQLLIYRDPVAMDTKNGDLPAGVAMELADPNRWIGDIDSALPDVVEEFLGDMIVKLGLSD